MSLMEEEPPAGVPEWIVTFGDMMSLLLTFFIMLVSMSELRSEQRVAQAVEALRRRFGVQAENRPGAAKMRGTKVEAPVGSRPLVRGIRPGEAVMVGGSVLFDEGLAELSAEARHVLRTIAVELQGKPQKIEIRGHTSRRPLPADSPFQDHWDLAYSRCHAVMAHLESLDIDPRRMRLSVAAGYEPASVGGDSLLARNNSRVEVFLLNEVREDFDNAVQQRTTDGR
jgi:chemotaxis protein MotB